MSSFFTTPASQKKRKRSDGAELPRKRTAISERPPKVTKPARRKPRDDSISGSESDADEEPRDDLNKDEAAESTSGSEGE
jgi:ribosomal RNA-processing protein 9